MSKKLSEDETSTISSKNRSVCKLTKLSNQQKKIYKINITTYQMTKKINNKIAQIFKL